MYLQTCITFALGAEIEAIDDIQLKHIKGGWREI